ncbi:hypothetical protein BCR44DRAFT_157358 [Catenaria anguillulae PL171]|uniref:tRNA-binding domain-containing protein n=1 Tax=Catenaria anguillulae PL171 TaxID=765915 RepID=A0A1Y2HNL1_9FUNG|nr:hypothetical protein BCR44DRAFT_157358 [Catenaria anguillulae PL171]
MYTTMSHTYSVAKKLFDYITRQPKHSTAAAAQFAVAEYIALADNQGAFIGATTEKRNEIFKWVEFATKRTENFTEADAKVHTVRFPIIVCETSVAAQLICSRFKPSPIRLRHRHHAQELDQALLKSTFVAYNHTLSAADVFVFVAAHAFVAGNASKVATFPSLFRWVDLIQHSFGGAAEWKGKINVNPNTPLAATPTSTVASTGAPAAAAPVDAKHAAKLAKKEAKKAEKDAKKADKKAEKPAEPAAAAAAAPATAKEAKPAATAAAATPKTDAPASGVAPDTDPTRLDLRVGYIISAEKHPDAEALYVEKIDCGEDEPRTVISGLVNHIPLDQMQGRPCVVLCNLKPVKMRGIMSHAMVMCATGADGKVEVLSPPEGSKPGDLIAYEGIEGGAGPDAQLNPKKKVFESIQPGLFTNDELVAGFIKHDGTFCKMHVGGNPVLAQSVVNAPIR